MTPTQPTALEGVKLPVHVVPAKFGPIGRDIADASGKYIATAYLPEAAAQIAHALNSQGKLIEALQIAEDALAHSYDVTEWPATPDCCAQLALNAVRSAIQGAKGGGE